MRRHAKRTRRKAGRTPTERQRDSRYWSHAVTERSNALDLEAGVFRRGDPREIATSLKRSADRSRRRKGTSFQSAMSMLNFYVNRAGRNLGPGRKRVLHRAKDELRKLYSRAYDLPRQKALPTSA